MKTVKLLGMISVIVVMTIVGGCRGSGSGSSDTGSDTSDVSSDTSGASGTTSSIDISGYAYSVADTQTTYDDSDIVDNTSFDYTMTIDFTAYTAKLSSGPALDITAEGATPLTGVTISETSYGVTISSTIPGAVRYNLTGTLDGTLTVNSSSVYQLHLDGLDISATAGPALDLESSQKVFIVTSSGTTNTLSDSSSRSITLKASLYGKGPMVFSGEGELHVTGDYKHGIFSNDYIRVCGGKIDVDVSERDAVRSVNGFIFDDGELVVNATGTTTDDESKGIRVEGDDDTANGQDKGYIVINGGYITVTSVGKAITAAWDIDEDLGDNDAGNPDPFVEINNGVIDITTTGTPYETAAASLSPEGIEGKSGLTINSGYITIDATEDALNSGGPITINGGYLYCISDYDAIDANGDLSINGGVIVAIGGSQPEGAFDCDDNTFTVTGGTFVGIGGTTSMPSASSTQNVVVLGGLQSGRTVAIRDSSGATAFAYTIPQSHATMVLSSPDIAAGTWTLFTGGTASADETFHGLFLGSLGYSGGTAGTSITVSSGVTRVGGQIMFN